MGDLAWALLLAMTVVMAVAAVALTPWITRDRVLRGMLRDRLVIFTVDGGVFDGLLVRHDERTFIFIDVHERSGVVPVAAAGGEFVIDRARIAYSQRLATDGAMTVAPAAPAPAPAPAPTSAPVPMPVPMPSYGAPASAAA